MCPYVVAGQAQDLAKYPTHIIKELLETLYPTNEPPLPPKSAVKFALDRFLDTADVQISVLEEVKGTKTRQSIGVNSLWEFMYMPVIHVWVRINAETRPFQIDDIKNWIDSIITDNENTMPYGVDSIMCDPPEEIFNSDLRSNENEDITIIDTWNVRIQTYVKVYKWHVAP